MKRSITARFARFAAGASVAVGLLGGSAPSRAWSGPGHMAIAIIAYHEMKPQTRTAVDTLLKSHPDYAEWVKEIPADATPDQRNAYLFAIAATWPDRIKSGRDRSVTLKLYDEEGRNPLPSPLPTDARYPDLLMHKDWHYIDIPISADGVARKTVTPNVVTQISVCRDGVAAGKSAPSYRAYYLAWLAHLVGDVHQPLHAAGRFSLAFPQGDQGGNGVKLDREGPGESNNLHAYWDGLLSEAGRVARVPGGGAPGPNADGAPAPNPGGQTAPGPTGQVTNRPRQGGYSAQTNWKSIEADVAAIVVDEPKELAGFSPAVINDMNPVDWAHESSMIDQDFVYTVGPDAPGPLAQPDDTYHTTALRIAHQRGALAAHRLATMLDGALATP